MADSPFFHEVDLAVKKAIAHRKSYYQAETRDTDALNYLYKKMAYATATATGTSTEVVSGANTADPANQKSSFWREYYDIAVPPSTKIVKKSKTLGLTSGGGIGEGTGLYEKTLQNKNDYKILPKAHLNTVKISAEGDFGTILRCDISFTCYSLAQLEESMNFLTLGNDLDITYGWNKAGKAAGPEGKFTGKICNFSYSLNAQGGFDCTTNAIGMGPNTINVNATVTNESGGKFEKIDSAQVTTEVAKTVVNRMYSDCVAERQNKFVNGAGLLAIYPTVDKSTSKSVQNVAYVTLKRFVDTVNEYILNWAWTFSTKDLNEQYKIKFDDTWTQPKNMKQNLKNFKSGNPEILYPGFANYYRWPAEKYAGDALKYSDDTKPKNLLIHVNLIDRIINEEKPEKNATGKSRDASLSRVFERLFEEIKKATGGLVKLTLISDSNNKSMLISDPDNVQLVENKDTLVLTGVTQNGICRTASVVTKIPSEMATAAFVTTSKNLMDQSGAAKDILGQKNDDKDNPVPDLKEIYKQLARAEIEMMVSGITDKGIQDFSSAMSAYVDTAKTSIKQSVPYPIEFSCTLDGISGFKFGDTIKFNYLPAIYLQGNNKIAFTITKVEHDISANDWVTTLNTVCRLATNES